MCPIRSQSFKAYLHICQDGVLRRRPGEQSFKLPKPHNTYPPPPPAKQNSQQPQCRSRVPDFTQKPGKIAQTDNSTALIFPCAYGQPSFLAAGGRRRPPRAVPGAGSPPFPQDNVICFLCRRAFAKSRLSHA